MLTLQSGSATAKQLERVAGVREPRTTSISECRGLPRQSSGHATRLTMPFGEARSLRNPAPAGVGTRRRIITKATHGMRGWMYSGYAPLVTPGSTAKAVRR